MQNAANEDRSVVALFTAPAWCVPCQRFEPHWQKATETASNQFVKVDFGANPDDIPGHWATRRFGILGVPTVKFIDEDGPRDVRARTLVPFLKEIGHG